MAGYWRNRAGTGPVYPFSTEPGYVFGMPYAAQDYLSSSAPTAGVPGISLAHPVFGALSGRTSCFQFGYGEIPVIGAITPQDSGGPDETEYQIAVNSVVGWVPYSAEDREARNMLRAAINRLGRETDGAVAIDRHQSIVISGQTRISGPLTAVAIVAALVSLMVRLRPIFVSLGEYLPEIIEALPRTRVRQ
jgi:hypothetical protein